VPEISRGLPESDLSTTGTVNVSWDQAEKGETDREEDGGLELHSSLPPEFYARQVAAGVIFV